MCVWLLSFPLLDHAPLKGVQTYLNQNRSHGDTRKHGMSALLKMSVVQNDAFQTKPMRMHSKNDAKGQANQRANPRMGMQIDSACKTGKSPQDIAWKVARMLSQLSVLSSQESIKPKPKKQRCAGVCFSKFSIGHYFGIWNSLHLQ